MERYRRCSAWFANAAKRDDLLAVEESRDARRDALFLSFQSLQFSSELISKDSYKSVYKVDTWWFALCLLSC